MISIPEIEQRAGQPYVAIHKNVHMNNVPSELPPLIPEVSAWVEKNKLTPAGPVFFLYRSMDKNYELVTEVGIPVKEQVPGDNRVIGGEFPAGKYAVITYTGDYNHIKDAHRALEKWITENGLKEKKPPEANGSTNWGVLAEFYITDPKTEPDPEKWKTEIVFLVDE
jgi:effector-binding domain-containing protein